MKEITWEQRSQGIYYGAFQPGLAKFIQDGLSKIILINVVAAIREYPTFITYGKVLENAIRDKEWLMLPAIKVTLNAGIQELSGIINGKYITENKRYKRR